MASFSDAELKELQARIAGSVRGKVTLKLRSLAELLGRGRLKRLQSSTWADIEHTLQEGGIAYSLPTGHGANDYITLALRRSSDPQAATPLPEPRATLRPPAKILALSVRQPYVEQILRGVKREEYRSRPTNVRGRVYLYASNSPADDEEAWSDIRAQPGDLPTGVIVGTVEVVGSRRIDEGYYGWVLERPERLEKALRPKNHPQPAWFYPWPDGR